jgi:hypothetical protein
MQKITMQWHYYCHSTRMIVGDPLFNDLIIRDATGQSATGPTPREAEGGGYSALLPHTIICSTHHLDTHTHCHEH